MSNVQKSWTPEEEEFFKKNYGKMPTQEIAEKLGRSTGSIYSFARKSRGTKRKKAQPKKVVNIIEQKRKEFEAAIKEEEEKLLKELSKIQAYKDFYIK